MTKKHIVRRILAVALAAALALNVSALAALAAGRSTHYSVYTVIGDSIPAGYGLEGGALNIPHGEVVKGSYPELVAEGVGAKTVYNTSRVVYTVDEYLRFLDEDYEHELNHPENYYQKLLTQGDALAAELTEPGDFARQKQNVAKQVAAADLITVNLGNNDLATNALLSALFKTIYYTYGIAGEAAVSMLENDFHRADSLESLAAMVSRGENDILFTNMFQECSRYIARYKTDASRLIRDIRKWNPNAKILVLGMYDTFRNETPQDSAVRKVCSDVSVQVCNAQGNFWKNECPERNTYTYVDISDTEIHQSAPITSPLFWMQRIVNVHPDANGHRYIAQQILRAL